MRYVHVRPFWIIGCIWLAQCSEEPAARDGVRDVDRAKHWDHWSHWNHPLPAEDAASAKEIDAGVTAPPEEPPPAQADAGGNSSSNICNTVETIIDDMILPPDSDPQSPWDSGYGCLESGNNAPSWADALTGWGGVLHDTTESKDTNTAVEVRNMRVYLLHKSGQWEKLNASTDVGYEGYKEDFSGPAPLDDERTTPDGGIAVKIPNGSVFHFWPSDGNQVKVDTSDIGGIFVTFQAKLFVNDPSKPDDRSMARYHGVPGGDYYGNGKCCGEDGGEIGMGRFKFVTTDWQWFNFITVPTSQISSNPPPLECAGN
jgi:hypothetical protein